MSRTTDLLGEYLRTSYDNATFGGDSTALDEGAAEIEAAKAQVALAEGRLLHARYLTDRVDRPEELELVTEAGRVFAGLGDGRGEAEATFWAAVYHQVVRGDQATALPLLDRAHRLAADAGDLLVMSYVERHLAFVDAEDGRLDLATRRFEISVELRRRIGFLPGVAAGLLPLADLAAKSGDRDSAGRLLAEADAISRDLGLHAVARWISEVRKEHDLPRPSV